MKENTSKPAKDAQEALRKASTEGTVPSIENLMISLDRANTTIRNLKAQMSQMVEGYRDLQVRLAANEFQHRLEFLWKVLFTEDSKAVFGKEFVEKCNDEFKDMMFPQMPEELSPEQGNEDA